MEVNHADGLMTATTYGDATPAVSLAYDVFQRLSAASNAVATYAYANSALGAATNETATVGGKVHTLTRELDNRHRLASLGIGADQVHYVYDEENRIAAVSNDVFTVAYAYTPDGLDAGYAVTLTNGVVLARALTRDLYRRALVRTITNSVDGVAVNPLAYDYDVLNRVTTRNADALSYNARSEVISAMIEPGHTNRYEFDGIGNALWTSLNTATNTYTANALNHYTAIDATTLDYDGDGNLLTNGLWSYTWDSENRLTAVFSNSVCVVSNAYDHAHRRVLKVTPATTCTYLYDRWNLGMEIQSSNIPPFQSSTNLFVWGKDLSGILQGAGGVGGLLAVSLNGAWYFPFYDNNGNALAYADETGAIVAEYAYDAFGRTIAHSGALANAFAFRFGTKYFDAETGHYYYGYRFYIPKLMRWLNRDPIGEDGGPNLYAFCGNYSASQHDFLGLFTLAQAENSLATNSIPKEGKTWWGGSKYTDTQIFDEWLRLEHTLGAWWKTVPKCPKKLCIKQDGNIINPDNNVWLNPGVISYWAKPYHPGAVYEMRTRKGANIQYGNQCTYDKNGHVISKEPSAGSVDFFAPGNSYSTGHITHDVDTYKLAEQLHRASDYYSVRPVWNE